MSDILIKGMEMPEDGEPVTLTICADGLVFEEFKEPGDVFHAVHVQPHGRLIEAEPIMKFITDGLISGEFGYDQIKVLTEIQYAPTIIPAEEGE